MNVLPEHSILKIMLDKTVYMRYNNIIYTIFSKDNNSYLYNICKALEALHSKSKESLSLEDLHVEFLTQHPHISIKDRALYDEIFKLIQESSASKESVQELLGAVRKKSLLQHLALKSYEAANAGKGYQDVLDAMAALQTEDVPSSENEDVLFVTDDLEQLYQNQVKEPGLRWRLYSLNQNLGSLRKGDFGFILARPETGKTTFLSSEVSHMAGQVKEGQGPVIWFNNEEQGEKVKLRQYQAALGIDLPKLISNRKKNQEEYLKLTKGNLKLIDDANISKSFVERVCKQYQPSLVIFDQIDKIKGFQSDRTDLELGAIYQWARELAKQYCPVIGVCQADGTAEGVKYLNMGHAANAKTAKQAEADWMLGIGRTNEPGLEYVRHFCISKNKLFGDEDTIPENKHAKWDVAILPLIARYQDQIQG